MRRFEVPSEKIESILRQRQGKGLAEGLAQLSGGLGERVEFGRAEEGGQDLI